MEDTPDYIDISEKRASSPATKAGSWGSMNGIQKTGVIGLFPFLVLSWIFEGWLGNIFGLIGWSSILMGYVAGNLWRYRHALHFWWSVAVALMIHASLLPVYANLTALIRDSPGRSTGKGYLSLAFGLMAVEAVVLQIVLKRTAMWIHRRSHRRLESLGNGLR